LDHGTTLCNEFQVESWRSVVSDSCTVDLMTPHNCAAWWPHAERPSREAEGGSGRNAAERAGVGGNRRPTTGARAEQREARSGHPATGGGSCPRGQVWRDSAMVEGQLHGGWSEAMTRPDFAKQKQWFARPLSEPAAGTRRRRPHQSPSDAPATRRLRQVGCPRTLTSSLTGRKGSMPAAHSSPLRVDQGVLWRG